MNTETYTSEYTSPEPKPRKSRSRNQRFQMLLSEFERRILDERAEAMGITVADVLRLGIFGNKGLRVDPTRRAVLDELAPVLRDLDGIGNNVNQIAKRLNEEAKAGIPHDDVKNTLRVIAQMHKAMQSVETSIAEALLKLVR